MKLRPYESKAVRDLLRLLKKHKRVVGVAPTGSGKTVIGAALIRAMRSRRVLWVAHRIELLKQARRELIRASVPESDVGILSGPEKVNEGARVLVASVDMFRSRLVPKCDLIVVDEAHRILAASYRDIIDVRPNASVLGLTATPWRLDGEPLGDVFAHLLVMAEAVELIADKFIASPIVYGVPQEKARAIVSGLKIDGGEYRGKGAEAAAMRHLMGDVVDECERLAPGERTLVFATTRKHGKALAGRFVKKGRRVAYLDGETPTSEREALLGPDGKLVRGEVDVVVNVDVLSEGFDCPPVKCIALARPTRSLTRFLQQCGRGSRPFGDQRPIVLDHAGNVWRFGLPDAPREWSLNGRAKAGATGEGPVKRCPECERMMPTGCSACPGCGAEQSPPERELAEHKARLEMVRAREAEKKAALARLREVAVAKGAPADWCEKVIASIFGESAA